MTKTMLYQIIKPVEPEGISWNEFGKILHELTQETQMIKNKTLNLYHRWICYCFETKKNTGVWPSLKDTPEYNGYTLFSGYAYDAIKKEVEFMNTSNYITCIRDILTAYDTHKMDIVKGIASIPSANKNQPVDLHNKSVKLSCSCENKESENEENENENSNKEENSNKKDNFSKKDNFNKKDSFGKNYIATFSLLSNQGKKNFGLKKGQISVVVKVPNSSSQKDIFEKCLSGEYAVSASKIIRKKNKVFLSLCYSFDNENTVKNIIKKNGLDKNKIMGVDLGIAVPVYMAFNFDDKKRASIVDSRIINMKVNMDKQLSKAKKSCAFTGQGNSGHGRNKKVSVYDKFSHKSSNMSKTINHTWAKKVVEVAKQNGCGVIQMEDLSGITSLGNQFLKNWTYYDLQQKIICKAKENGIEVKKVNPKFTSQRCSKCGYIHPDNRPEQSVFKCLSCGFSANADFNAARNISVECVDEVIKKWMNENKELVKECGENKENKECKECKERNVGNKKSKIKSKSKTVNKTESNPESNTESKSAAT